MPPRRTWNPHRHERQERRERRQQQQQQLTQQDQYQPQLPAHQAPAGQQPIAPADLAIIQAATVFLDALHRSRRDQFQYADRHQHYRPDTHTELATEVQGGVDPARERPVERNEYVFPGEGAISVDQPEGDQVIPRQDLHQRVSSTATAHDGEERSRQEKGNRARRKRRGRACRGPDPIARRKDGRGGGDQGAGRSLFDRIRI